MNILDTIIAAKKLEVASRKIEIPIRQLEQSPLFQQAIPSLRANLLQPGTTGIIAEFKRKSPSKGIIHPNANAGEITQSYAAGGASGISVLTDASFFGGSWADLEAAIGWGVPVLRKDFIIDEYQIGRAHV